MVQFSMTGDADAPVGGQYSGRVLILFATSVLTTGIAFLIGLMLARLLGPAGKGDFYLLTLLPATLTVLIQLGLPQAFGYFAARGQTVGINAKSVVLTVALGFPALLVTILLIPILRTTIMDFVDPYEIILGVCVLPLLLMATFTTGTLLGRQAIRWYASVSIGLTIASLCIYVTIVGILGFGLVGALWAAVLVACIGPAGYLIGSMRATRRIADPQRVTYRELFRYGLPLYPGNLTQYFSARVDVYLLAWLLPNPAAPLGFYSMAVTMAQTVFFFPDRRLDDLLPVCCRGVSRGLGSTCGDGFSSHLDRDGRFRPGACSCGDGADPCHPSGVRRCVAGLLHPSPGDRLAQSGQGPEQLPCWPRHDWMAVLRERRIPGAQCGGEPDPHPAAGHRRRSPCLAHLVFSVGPRALRACLPTIQRVRVRLLDPPPR